MSVVWKRGHKLFSKIMGGVKMIENALQIFWTEKYRPSTLEDIILPEKEKETIYQAIKMGKIPHYLFIGPPGTGKTSLAKVIINELNATSLIINASEERGIDTIRDKVMRFIQIAIDKPKIVLLDEADSLTGEAQASLRNVMETYSNLVRFILTGNYDKFIAPIKDRCEVVRFKQLSKGECLSVLRRIVVNENIELETGDELTKIIDTFYPSIRKMIANLQKYSTPIKNQDGEIVGYKLKLPEKLSKEDETDFEDIYNMFVSGKDIHTIREKLYELGITDFIPLYRFFFKKFVESGDELAAITTTEYMYRDTFVADKEINFVGMMLSIRNRAYPFIIANNIENIIEGDRGIESDKVRISQYPSKQQLTPTQQPPSFHSTQPNLPTPKSKPKLPKLPTLYNPQPTNTPPNTQSQLQPSSLHNLNKLLKSTRAKLKDSENTTDFTNAINDIYNQFT